MKAQGPSLLIIAAAACCGVISIPHEAHGTTNILERIKRTLTKEPVYQSVPKYSLLVLGTAGDSLVWMVEDGRRLFVDKNANGDLTDDGPAATPTGEKTWQNGGTNYWSLGYLIDAITPTNGSRHTGFSLGRWNYGDKDATYSLSLSINDRLPMYAGWFGTFWSTNSDTAPLIHFGGPFTPRLLRGKDFTIGAKRERLSICFLNPGSGPGAESRVSIEAWPRSLAPTMNIEWPTEAGRVKRRTSHLLSERCCYWEFYTTSFEMPDGVVPGTAKLTVEFASGLTPIELKTTEIEAPVVEASATRDSVR